MPQSGQDHLVDGESVTFSHFRCQQDGAQRRERENEEGDQRPAVIAVGTDRLGEANKCRFTHDDCPQCKDTSLKAFLRSDGFRALRQKGN